ncbi:MAG: hypothetical protein MUC97_13340 [Bernardetiaceae bacterium]|jgi:hypothetical protein|nr:hypothetical protein [Bernardetiaceae bacterium]
MEKPDHPCRLICKVVIQPKKPRPNEPPKNYPEKYCLLNICPELPGQIARPALQVDWEGMRLWREYDIEKTFETEEEALAYAREHQIVINLADA